MGIYSIVVLSLAVFAIVIGMLSGMIRGSRRAILRLILVVASLALAIFLNNTVVNLIKDIKIGDQALPQMIMSAFPEDFEKYENIIMPMILSLASVFTFILCFLALQIVTLVLYWICKLFVKPKKNAAGIVDKNPFIGMFIGMIQGIIVALVYGAMLTGLGKNFVKVAEVEMNEEKLIDLDSIEKNLNLNIALEEYCDSNIATIFDKAGGFIYKTATTIELDGEKYTCDGQIEALTKAIAVADEISALSEIDFSNGITEDNKDDIIEVLNNLDNMTSDMTEEVTNTLNEMIHTIAGDMLEVDLTGLDMSEVQFDKIANVVEVIDEVTENPTQENIDQIVNDLVDSNVIFVLADATDISLDEFDEETKTMITDSISKQDDLTAEEKAKLETLFGIK